MFQTRDPVNHVCRVPSAGSGQGPARAGRPHTGKSPANELARHRIPRNIFLGRAIGAVVAQQLYTLWVGGSNPSSPSILHSPTPGSGKELIFPPPALK